MRSLRDFAPCDRRRLDGRAVAERVQRLHLRCRPGRSRAAACRCRRTPSGRCRWRCRSRSAARSSPAARRRTATSASPASRPSSCRSRRRRRRSARSCRAGRRRRSARRGSWSGPACTPRTARDPTASPALPTPVDRTFSTVPSLASRNQSLPSPRRVVVAGADDDHPLLAERVGLGDQRLAEAVAEIGVVELPHQRGRGIGLGLDARRVGDVDGVERLAALAQAADQHRLPACRPDWRR